MSVGRLRNVDGVFNSFTRSRIVSSEMSGPCIYLDMQSKCLEYNDNNELVRCHSVIRKLMRRVGKKQKIFAQGKKKRDQIPIMQGQIHII